MEVVIKNTASYDIERAGRVFKTGKERHIHFTKNLEREIRACQQLVVVHEIRSTYDDRANDENLFIKNDAVIETVPIPDKRDEPTSIIILTITNIINVKRCIESVKRFTDNYELIIIGNAPDKEVKDYILNLKDIDAKIVINSENKGVPYGWNQGLKIASHEFICFLNDDTVVTPDWLCKLQKAFELYPDCGVASPTTCLSGGTQCVWSLAKDRFTMTDAEIVEYAGTLKEGYLATRIYGFCMLTKKKILSLVGGFDYKRYGLGLGEETDLTYRLDQLDFKSYWVQGAYVHHLATQSFITLKIDANALGRKAIETYTKRMADKTIPLYVKNDVPVPKFIKIKKDRTVPVKIKNNIVVYTAITGGKDKLREDQIIDSKVDYVAFLENSIPSKVWEVREIYRKFIIPVRDARMFKILPWQFLDYEYSIWMDGEFAIKCKASDLIDKFLNGFDIAVYKHPCRDCVYEEFVQDIKVHKYELPVLAYKERQKYLDEGIPIHSGLAATGILIRRHTETIKQFCKTWWAENSAFHSSDQCNFMYATLKHDLRINWITDGDIYKNPYFNIGSHAK